MAKKIVPFVIGAAACDWLTLTTFDAELFHKAAQITTQLRDGTPSGTGKKMQYQGVKGEGWFAGVADQMGRSHYLLEFTGATAHKALECAETIGFSWAGWTCTRIDVQCTIPNPVGIELPEIAREARKTKGSEWGGKGKRPKLPYYDDDDDKDSMYIGSRHSPRMQRIYRKYSGDNERFMRWETEFKDKLAPAVWQRYIIAGQSALANVLAAEIQSTPECISTHFGDMIELLIMGDARVRMTRDVPDYERTWEWVQSSLTGTIADLLASPVGSQVGTWLVDRLSNAVALKLGVSRSFIDDIDPKELVSMLSSI